MRIAYCYQHASDGGYYITCDVHYKINSRFGKKTFGYFGEFQYGSIENNKKQTKYNSKNHYCVNAVHRRFYRSFFRIDFSGKFNPSCADNIAYQCNKKIKYDGNIS